MKVVMFAGAGAVGKTKLLEATQIVAQERHLEVAVYKSNTRATYVQAGLTGEKQALDNEEFNMQFQHEVMRANCEALVAAALAANANSVDLFITDRSPYDYASYYLSVFQSRLTLKMIEQKRTQADEWFCALLRNCEELHGYLLPYPAPWSGEGESSDGWRADKVGKNFIWSAVAESEIADANRRLRSQKKATTPFVPFSLERLPVFFEFASPELRASSVLHRVFPELR